MLAPLQLRRESRAEQNVRKSAGTKEAGATTNHDEHDK